MRLFTMPTVESSQESTGRRLRGDSRHSTGLGRLGVESFEIVERFSALGMISNGLLKTTDRQSSDKVLT